MKLNLASGPALFAKPWLNVDHRDQSEYIRILTWDITPAALEHWPAHQRRLAQAIAKDGVDFKQHDLREGLPWVETDTVGAIYFGQAIEHFAPHEVPKLLAECKRVLRPGGKIRITTPDLGVLLKAYASDDMMRFADEQPAEYRDACPSAQLAMILYGSLGPDSTLDNYEGHQFIYDEESLVSALNDAGLSFLVVDRQYGIQPSDEFSGTEDFGMSHSMAVEAVA